MSEQVHGVRPAKGELDVWKAAAVAAGLPYNGWVRRALNLVAKLEAAHALQGVTERAAVRGEDREGSEETPVSAVRSAPAAVAVRRGVRTAMCVHRVAAGAFCRRCDG